MTVKPPVAPPVVKPPEIKPPVQPPSKKGFWNQVSSCGQKPIFATPEEFWDAATEYFDWAEANPILEPKLFCNKDGIHDADLPKLRAFTLNGMQLYLDITQTTWYNYKKKEGFKETAAKIERVIKTQKFEGAAAGIFSQVIIARDLGLKESSEISGPNGGPIESASVEITHEMSAERAAELYRDIMK